MNLKKALQKSVYLWLNNFFWNFQGFLGQKKDLWDLLQIVEKSNPEAADITASARELPTVK